MTSIIFLLNGFIKGFSVLHTSEEITFVLLREAFTEMIIGQVEQHRRPSYIFLHQVSCTRHVIAAHLTFNCLPITVNEQSFTTF